MTPFEDAISRFDAANAEDPVIEVAIASEAGSVEVPRALLYGQRMSACLDSFMGEVQPAGQPSEALRLAVRAQHLKRFEMPRSDYPMDRPGYLRWRSDSAKHHAALAGAILQAVGYDDAMVERVGHIVRKKNRATDPEAQILEDVACLVFLTHYCEPFIADKDDDAVVRIFEKTWAKMSGDARRGARALPLGDRSARLLAQALG